MKKKILFVDSYSGTGAGESFFRGVHVHCLIAGVPDITEQMEINYKSHRIPDNVDEYDLVLLSGMLWQDNGSPVNPKFVIHSTMAYIIEDAEKAGLRALKKNTDTEKAEFILMFNELA